MDQSKRKTRNVLGGVALGVLVLLTAGLVWGKTVRMTLANHALNSGAPAKARRIYENMAVDMPDSPFVLHNLGLAAYREGQYDQAAQLWKKALEKIEKTPGRHRRLRNLQAQCHYQLGNALFEEAGSPKESSLNSSAGPASLYKEALEHFKQSLKIAPADQDAKYNYELTQLRLQDAERQPETQNRNSKDSKDKNKGSNSPKDSQNSKSSDNKGNSKESKDLNHSQNSQNQTGQNPNSNPQSGETNRGQAGKPGENQGMTKQEAQSLLDAAENGAQYLAPLSPQKSSVHQDW